MNVEKIVAALMAKAREQMKRDRVQMPAHVGFHGQRTLDEYVADQYFVFQAHDARLPNIPALGTMETNDEEKIEALIEEALDANATTTHTTPDAIRTAMRERELTGSGLAHLVGVNPRTVRRWTGGNIPIPYAAWTLLQQYSVAYFDASIDDWPRIARASGRDAETACEGPALTGRDREEAARLWKQWKPYTAHAVHGAAVEVRSADGS